MRWNWQLVSVGKSCRKVHLLHCQLPSFLHLTYLREHCGFIMWKANPVNGGADQIDENLISQCNLTFHKPSPPRASLFYVINFRSVTISLNEIGSLMRTQMDNINFALRKLQTENYFETIDSQSRVVSIPHVKCIIPVSKLRWLVNTVDVCLRSTGKYLRSKPSDMGALFRYQ